MFLVLGGSGFIGTSLRKCLAEQSIPCAVISRNCEALRDSAAPLERFVDFLDFEGAPGEEIIREASVFVYLASASVPATFASQPWRDIDENVSPAARTFWRVATLNPRAKIIFVSSGGTIYGDRPNQLTSEQAVPAPTSGYGLGKLLIEDSLRFVSRTTGAPYAILRVSNPVGPHQANNAQGIVTLAIRAALDKSPIYLFDEGRQVRDYIDVDDVGDAIIAAAKAEIASGIWNIGSGIGHSTVEMLKMVEGVTGREIHIELRPRRPVDVSYIVLDINLAQAQLRWSPARPIRDAVVKVCESFMSAADFQPDVTKLMNCRVD